VRSDPFSPGTPSGSSEVTVPEKARWWTERAREYVESRRGVSEEWRERTFWVLSNMAHPSGHGLRRREPLFVRLGFPAPVHHTDVTPRMIEALRGADWLSSSTRQNWMSRLKGFLGWCGNPVAADPDLWRFGKPVARRRPYVDVPAMRSLLTVAEGRERLLLAVLFFNGARPCELLRSRAGDWEMDETPPMVTLRGKGRYSGKERRIPVNPLAYGEVLPFVRGRRPEDPVWPGTYAAIDKTWRRLLKRAGLPARGLYALRRGFGRVSHDAGVPIEEIQAIYGHASPATTAHYIGVEETRMARGLARMAEAFAAP
jgi:integrase